MKPGQLLIALPSIIGDLHFHRAIIYLVECNAESTFGFVVNKKLDYHLNDVVEGLKPTIPLYFGGPVEPDNLYYIHTLGDEIPKSLPINNKYFWSGDFEMVIQLLNEKPHMAKEFRFFLGYAGWEENQLENELNSEAWHLSENNYVPNLLQQPTKTMWREEMVRLGGKYIIWANAPDNPNSN